MNEIDLRSEHHACLAELTAHKELYRTLVLHPQDLTDTVKPNLEAKYAVNISYKQPEVLKKQAEVAGLKYTMDL